jgi:hypothetical protein
LLLYNLQQQLANNFDLWLQLDTVLVDTVTVGTVGLVQVGIADVQLILSMPKPARSAQVITILSTLSKLEFELKTILALVTEKDCVSVDTPFLKPSSDIA